jgi:hypothetical protein
LETMAAAASTNWRSLQEMSTAMAESTDPSTDGGGDGSGVQMY